MTLSHLPAPSDVPYEPWEGEAEALAAAAAVGRRAAAWLRSLPAPPDTILGESLAAAVESVTAGLDPRDENRPGPDWTFIEGQGGADSEAMTVLAAVPCAAPAATWLTPDQQVRMVAVASLVVGAVRVLVQDPGTAIRSELAVIWALLDHVIAWPPTLWRGATVGRTCSPTREVRSATQVPSGKGQLGGRLSATLRQ
ncbi:hypothetical protein ACFWRV_06695 [Streptomyces sp. NPDC058576]|uniref:hypothetical protein n=1 Tax=Streptomyces sp. NPDC058576 TaxID=3346547 RepID=UPI0036480B1E